MSQDHKYASLLSRMRQEGPFNFMIRSGLTPEQVKEAVVEALEPYFEHRDLLVEHALSALLPEAGTIMRLSDNPRALAMIENCLDTHRRAKQVLPHASLTACAAWLPATLQALSIHWSQYHLERNKATLDIEEFLHACLHDIGAIVEGTAKPYLKELLHQLRISRGTNSTVQQIDVMELGAVVDELIQHVGYSEMFMPAPWGIRVNQWRNIAQHLSCEISGDQIRCNYGRPSQRQDVTLTRHDMLDVVRTLYLVLSALKFAQTIFFIDNLHDIRALGAIPSYGRLRPEMEVLNFTLALASQGFELVDIKWSTDEAVATIQDCSSMDTSMRRIHVSQFCFVLWDHAKSLRSTVEYRDKDGTPDLRASIDHAACERFDRGEIEIAQVAKLVELTDLRTGRVIPPLPAT